MSGGAIYMWENYIEPTRKLGRLERKDAFKKWSVDSFFHQKSVLIDIFLFFIALTFKIFAV